MSDSFPDGATVDTRTLRWRYDAKRGMWDGRRRDTDAPVVKRRRQGSRASDDLWFRYRHGMSAREHAQYIAGSRQ